MQKANILLRIPLLTALIFILPSIAFATDFWDSDFEHRTFVSAVHTENIEGFSTTFNLTDSTILDVMQDCSYMEIYDNDNTTKPNYALIDWLSINGTNCFYKVNMTSEGGFWF